MSEESQPENSLDSHFRRYALAFRSPLQPVILSEFRRPQDILDELREVDPDGHANLTEHLVVPKRSER